MIQNQVALNKAKLANFQTSAKISCVWENDLVLLNLRENSGISKIGRVIKFRYFFKLEYILELSVFRIFELN